jgi:hypothetical protein
MKHIYDITDKVRDSISSNGITNTVTFGDLLDVDLDKTTMFPLAHITLGTAIFAERLVIIPLNILFIDIVDVNKSLTDDDIFYGNDNLQDVLNTQFQAANLIQSQIRRGSLFQQDIQLVADVLAEPFLDNFENQLAGWSIGMDVQMINGIDIDIS